MKHIFEWLRARFRSKSSGNVLIRRMMEMLTATKDQELSCDDVYSLLDQFAEAILRKEPLPELFKSIDQHLKVCPDCREEYEALLAMMRAA